MKITAYTTRGCYYCDQLKKLFERAGVDATYIQINTEDEKKSFREQYDGAKSYPYVIIDDEHVGGLVETAKLFLEKGLVSAKK